MSQGINSVLKRIEKKGKALLMSGASWEDGMIDFELSLEGFTQLEMQLINDWISAWRTRIIKSKRTQIAFIVCRLSGTLAVRVPIAM